MKLPRVTQILSYYTNYHQLPPEILKKASTRGSAVHGLCEGIAKGQWIPESMIDEELKGYVESFRKWSAAQVKEFYIIERRYTHDGLGYTGQVDMVIRGTDGKLYLTDLKTTASPMKTHPVQMAAYQELLKANGIETVGVMLVYLNKDGGFPEIDLFHELHKEFGVFLSARECWYYFNERDSTCTEEEINTTSGSQKEVKL